MPLSRKANPAQTVLLSGQIPAPPPKIPAEMVRRFPAWAEYQKGLDEWWGKFTDQLQRDRSQIQGQFTADETATQDLQSTLTTLTAQVQALISQGGNQFDPSGILAQLQAISDGLTLHLAATVAHGTNGNIVGDIDGQNLEHKSLGLTSPGYGRFVSLMVSNRIPGGVSVTVPVGSTMIVGPDFQVDGLLNVAGNLFAL